MLLEEYDKSPAIINPPDFYQRIDGFPKTCLCFFSKLVMNEFVRAYKPKKIVSIQNETMAFDIFRVRTSSQDIAVMQIPVGGAASAAMLEEVIQMGARTLFVIGCCGVLESSIKECSIILPTAAIRDEGTSYHYLPKADEIGIDSQLFQLLKSSLDNMKIHYTLGKVWTTDAPYRETREKMLRRKTAGAVAVDMECASIAAMAKFRGVNFCQMFYSADNLGGEKYDKGSLQDDKNVDKKYAIIPLSLKLAAEIDSSQKTQN